MSVHDQVKKQMEQAVDHLVHELSSVRTGRANPSILENVQVEAYGSKMRLRDLASISNPEPRQLLVSTFDPTTTGEVGKGIEAAGLGFRISIEGNLVRVTVPEMSESVRKDMVKLCKKRCEEAKISIRNIRRDFNDKLKNQKKNGDITEDDLNRMEKDIQDLTDKFCSKADELTHAKEKEVMEV